MRTSAFAFPTDLVDEGVDVVLDRLAGAGIGGVALAAVYHAARDVFPHNPRRRLVHLRGGDAAFAPDAARYDDHRPVHGHLLDGRDVLGEAVAAAGARGLDVHAWTVFLHADLEHAPRADLAERTPFSDPRLTDLCPAHPAVRRYACAVAGDVAARGVATVLAESLHYHPLEHGAHHERYLVRLSPLTRLLLGTCFCEHCLAAAADAGVDGAAARARAVAAIEAELAGGGAAAAAEARAPDPTRADLAEALGADGAYLDVRERTVASLVEEVAAAVRAEGARLVFMDPSGAVKGYATGRPTGAPAPEIAWRLGVDVARCAAAADGLEAIGYAADPARVELDLAAYAALLPAGRSLDVALRPTVPDCDDPANLAAKLAVADALGATRVDLYHYGLAPLSALETVRAALAAHGRPGTPEGAQP